MHRKSKFNRYGWSAVAAMLAFLALLVWAGVSDASIRGSSRSELDQRFTGTVLPFLRSYCTACHGKQRPQAQLDLSVYANAEAVVRDYPHWSLVLEKLAAKQMPPPSAGRQPTAHEREGVKAWIRAVREYEAERNAGDPGPVRARRLSNAEYDYTIRDLTGVDLRPTREFPVDPANQEGFDNSGESLTFSPALTKKYAQAAKEIADHLVLTSTGLEFAAHPVLVETDRDKFCILRIVDFYKRQPTDYADYFHAAWRYRYRAVLGAPKATLQTAAADAKISPRYLELVWNTLTSPAEKVGPIARLQEMWNALPIPDKDRLDAAQPVCSAMRNWVLALRKKVARRFDNLRVPRGFSDGGQCFVLWKDRQYASHRRLLNPGALQVGGVPPSRIVPARRYGGRTRADQTVTDPVDPDLAVPQDAAARAPYLAAFTRFCSVFPDAFYISERGRMFVDDPGDKGRLLTAGLHNSMGYFRDDVPLMELILDENGRRNLDHLWLDFDMVASVPERMHLEFFVYERAEAGTITDPEFNFARAEDKSALSDAKIKLLGDLYLAKARRNGGEPPALQAIEDHFKWVSETIRATERSRLAAEPAQLKALIDFARRAYRRPLTDSERSDLLVFYRSLRQSDGLGHEDAIRDTVISILMSPNFLFRLDLDAAEGSSTPRSPSGERRTAAAPRGTTGRTTASPRSYGPYARAICVNFATTSCRGTHTGRLKVLDSGGLHVRLHGRKMQSAMADMRAAAGPDLASSQGEPVRAKLFRQRKLAQLGVRAISSPHPAQARVDDHSRNSVQPLSDYALASRMSYFLWSSMPDAELLAHAAAGDLHRPEVLAEQGRRMLRDRRIRALALEFGGNWLDFRRFEEHNAVDRARFPGFNDDLREAMFEEPVRFLMDEFQNDRSVLDLLYGKYTFVNATLARHYGMTGVKPASGDWVRVDDADRYGRGGLLPMAVFLTKNSPGLRTSPVKRGNWVVRRLLGETIPPPPPVVPQLPSDESKMGELTLRQALAQHRSDPACAGCHARFDSYGLVFEGYGPIGELRDKDLGGKPVDARAPFPGGIECTGVTGLQEFVRRQRQMDFLNNICRKLLSYGLGRSLQPSDDSTLLEMQRRLAAGGYRFETLVDTVVTSRQFRNRRTSAQQAGAKVGMHGRCYLLKIHHCRMGTVI